MPAVAKSERIQLRTSPEAKAQILRAASITQQDATSFILGAATDRARAVLLEQQILKLSTADLQQIEEALEQAERSSPELQRLFSLVSNDKRLAN